VGLSASTGEDRKGLSKGDGSFFCVLLKISTCIHSALSDGSKPMLEDNLGFTLYHQLEAFWGMGLLHLK